MEVDFVREVFVLAFCTLAVPTILSLPLFFFLPSTHSFLHKICCFVVTIHIYCQQCVWSLFALPEMLLSKISHQFSSRRERGYRIRTPRSDCVRKSPGSVQVEKTKTTDDYPKENTDGKVTLSEDGAVTDGDFGCEGDDAETGRTVPQCSAQTETERHPIAPTVLMGNASDNQLSTSDNDCFLSLSPMEKSSLSLGGKSRDINSANASVDIGYVTGEYGESPVETADQNIFEQDDSLKNIEYSCTRKDVFDFIVDEKGGRLRLRFTAGIFIVNFSCNAVSERTRLRLAIAQEKKYHDGKMFQVIPALHCFRHIPFSNNFDIIRFNHPIGIRAEMKVNLDVQEMELQVTKSSNKLDWIRVEDVQIIKEQDWISFSLDFFAGVRVVVQQPLQNLFGAVYLKRPTGITDPAQHHFVVHVYSGSKKTLKESARTLASDANEIVFGRQLIPVRPPCKLTVSLNIEGMVSNPAEVVFNVPCTCPEILVEEHITIAKIDRNIPAGPGVSMQLQRKMRCDGNEYDRSCGFYWNAPLKLRHVSTSSIGSIPRAELTFNVWGQNAIGMQCNSNSAVPSSPPEFLSRSESAFGFREHLLPPPVSRTSAPLIYPNASTSSSSDDDAGNINPNHSQLCASQNFNSQNFRLVDPYSNQCQVETIHSTPIRAPLTDGHRSPVSLGSPISSHNTCLASFPNPAFNLDSGVNFSIGQ